MYGPLILAAAILLSIAGVVLFLHDLFEARSRKAFDRIFEEGGTEPLSAPGSPRQSARRGLRKTPTRGAEPPPSEPRRPGSAYRIITPHPSGGEPPVPGGGAAAGSPEDLGQLAVQARLVELARAGGRRGCRQDG